MNKVHLKEDYIKCMNKEDYIKCIYEHSSFNSYNKFFDDIRR